MVSIDIEMPKNCSTCPFFVKEDMLSCACYASVINEFRFIYDKMRALNERMDWCPLKKEEK